MGLPGCHWCRALTGELDELRIPYSFIDANENGELADKMEALLDADEYPMILISNDSQIIYYIYRPSKVTELGLGKVSHNIYKMGCVTIDSMVSTIDEIFKKY